MRAWYHVKETISVQCTRDNEKKHRIPRGIQTFIVHEDHGVVDYELPNLKPLPRFSQDDLNAQIKSRAVEMFWKQPEQ